LRPTTYANGRLPQPLQATGGYIHSVSATPGAESVAIDWTLNNPGITQVWYNVVAPSTITETTQLTHTSYLPLVDSSSALSFSHELPVDFEATQLWRTATVTGLSPGQRINYVVVARRLVGDACVTEYAGPYEAVALP
jgi:hypothetical protein